MIRFERIRVDDDILTLTEAVTASGPGREEEGADVLPGFAERERADSSLTREQFRQVDVPGWAIRLFRNQASSIEILRTLLDHIRRSRKGRLHLVAELIVNEVADYPDGQEAIDILFSETLAKELESGK